MAKYSADIEIAVRGGQQISGLIRGLNRLNNSINIVNKNAKLLEGKGFNVASIENYSRAVNKAEGALRKAAQGTNQERIAVQQLVTAMELENKARSRRNFLIAQEVASRRQVIATANAGVGVQGPALPRYMMTGPSSPIGGSLRGRGGGGRGGIGSRLGGAVSGSIIGGAFPLLFGQGGGAAAGGAIGGLLGGFAGPGGSFAGSLLGTLLGDIASRGQAIKTLAQDMGLAADQTQKLSAAFKTANTDVEKFTAVIQNIRGIGLELEDQVKAIELVTRLTELYGGSFEKTGKAITSALESGKVSQATLNQLTSENIKIQDALAAKYNLNRSQLLQMAKDGKISVQDLIDTLVVLGNAVPQAALKQQNAFEQAYEGIATAAAQATQNVINEYSKTSAALASAGEGLETLFTSIFSSISTGIADIILGIGKLSAETARGLDPVIASFINLQNGLIGAANAVPLLDRSIITFAQNALAVLNPVGFLIDKIRGIGQGAREGFIGPEVPDRLKRAPLTTFRVPGQLPPSGGGKTGPKPPEDRTAQLREELNAIVAIGQAEDKIRDLLFEGRDILAAEAELQKEIADIERDRNKALLGANYESERLVINKIAEARIVDAQLKNEDKIRQIQQQRFEEQLQNNQAIKDSIKPMVEFRREQELQNQYTKNYLRLVAEGILPSEAERILNFEKLVEQSLYEIDLQIKKVEEQLQLAEATMLEAEARGLNVKSLEEELALLRAKQKAIQDAAVGGAGEGPTDAERLQSAIGAARGQLNELTDPINQIIAGAQAIGDAFQQAFMGLVTGAMTGQQALAAFFKGVSDHFFDMASKMIAKLIEIWILETVLGFIGGAAGGMGASFSGGTSSAIPTDIGGWTQGFNTPLKFAEGGFITGPTNAIIGEGGESEYVIPASKMNAAMARYSRGARGESVLAGDTGSEAGAPAAATGSTAIDVRYSVERINNVEYVTADQFREGMRQAALQGAAQGEQRTLRRLQQSPSTRRRVGV